LNVCNLLLFLADTALQAIGFAPGEPRYISCGQGDGADDARFEVTGGEGDNSSDMEDEAIAARSDDDDGAGAGAARQEAGEGSASMEDSGGSPRGGTGSGRRGGLGASMVMGGIDPMQWKAETERVAVKLAAHTARTQGGHLSSEWMDHVEALKQYRVAHTMSATGADGDGAQERAGRHRAPTVSATALAAQLQVMRADIGSYQARIRSLEQLLNRTGGVPAAALTFTALRSVRP
jgi:hypothetical protein